MLYLVLICAIVGNVLSRFDNASVQVCNETHFKLSGKCVPDEFLCEELEHAQLALPATPYERICSQQYCPDYAYNCTSSSLDCIDREDLCDGNVDCDHSEDEYYDSCPPVDPDCGFFSSEDPKEIFPWHAAVWKNDVKICAASVIAPKYVLSAADCFWDFSTKNVSRGNFIVTAGLINNVFMQARKVANILMNGYQNDGASNHQNNVAVLELVDPFYFNGNVSAVCLFDYKMDFVSFETNDIYNYQMVTWTPGPNDYNGPMRLQFAKSLNLKRHNKRFQPDNTTKTVEVARFCGPISDHGGGVYLNVNERYFIHGIIDPPLGDIMVRTCLHRTITYVLPHIDYIKLAVDFEEGKDVVVVENLPKFSLNVGLVVPKKLFENCGKYNIFNDTGIFPWHCLIWREAPTGSQQLCSATLVTENLAITTASCIWNITTNSVRKDDFTVTAGANGDVFRQFRRVMDVVVQDYFSTEDEPHINNIAVLVLERPFDFDNHVGAACLYDLDIIPKVTVPIEHESMSISMISLCTRSIAQLHMDFIWNSKCNVNFTMPPENFKLCMKSIENFLYSPSCYTLDDSGAGLVVIEGGTYFFRGVLNPRDHPSSVFTNILPYVRRIADIQREVNATLSKETILDNATIVDNFNDIRHITDVQIEKNATHLRETILKNKTNVKNFEDIHRLLLNNRKENFNITEPFTVAFDFTNCQHSLLGDCLNKCDESSNFEQFMKCFNTGSSQECRFAYCQDGFLCKGTVRCL